MEGRFFAAVVAVLFVLPVVLTVDALVRPRRAWHRVNRSKWRWIAAFLVAPVGSLLATSFVPAIMILPWSIFYMARVRSVLDVASGLEAEQAGRPGPTPSQQEAAAPIVFVGLPVTVFLGIVLWTGGPRERLVALAIAVPTLSTVAFIVWRSLHRS